MKTIRILGAGFSGLSLASELNKKGFHVVVYERSQRVGGMVSTPMLNGMLNGKFYETAANSFMATPELEAFMSEHSISTVSANENAKKRYIFREGQPRRWPFQLGETFRTILTIVLTLLRSGGGWCPQEDETVEQWGRRFCGPIATQWLLAPALQGIYAGDVSRMSAQLVLPFSKSRRSGGRTQKSMISGVRGMGQVMEDLRCSLEKRGVVFEFCQTLPAEQLDEVPTVICTSAIDAELILKKIETPAAQENSRILAKVEMLPLVSATAFFERASHPYLGFGILFPIQEKIRALGMLMTSFIFSRNFYSETWILGGALQSGSCKLSDSEIATLVSEERAKVLLETTKHSDLAITRWPQALPHYTIEWRDWLKALQPMRNIYLHGNYLGDIGLSRILNRSIELANRIAGECL